MDPESPPAAQDQASPCADSGSLAEHSTDSEEGMRIWLDQIAAESLPTINNLLILIFGAFLIFNLVDLPPQARSLVVAYDVVLLLVYGGFRIGLARVSVRPRAAHGIVFLFGMLAISNIVLVQALLAEPFYTTYVMAVVIAMGYLLPARRWLVGACALSFAAWLSVALAVCTQREVVHYGVSLGVAIAIALLFNLVRTRFVRQNFELRRKDAHSRGRLEKRTAELHDLVKRYECKVREAESANQAKSVFLANMSHELRTPLNGVLGFCQLLMRTEVTLPQRRYLDSMRVSGENLLHIINDILDFSKIEAGKMDVQEQEFALVEEIEAAVVPLGYVAQAKGLDLVLDLGLDLPTKVRGDPHRIRQVLTNLVGNAVKFTESGWVQICVVRTESVIEFRVQDSGIGIVPEAQKHLFEAFSQADDAHSRDYGGTGLGLMICRRLTQLMGGSVELASSSEQGSTFCLRLPLTATELAPPPVRILEQRRVLVAVEADKTRAALLRLLEAWGADVVPLPAAVALKGLASSGAAIMIADGGRRELFEAAADAGIPSLPLLGSASGSLETSGVVATPIIRRRLQRQLVHLLDQTAGSTRGSDVGLAELPSLDGRRVLVVEDHAINREVVQQMLEQAGIRSKAVGNGQLALDALEQECFDAVLMDCQMPVMDGYTATQKIRERESGTGSRIPIIALTAHALSGEREKVQACGMDGMVTKPIRLSRLLEEISRWLRPDNEASRLPEPDASAASAEQTLDPGQTGQLLTLARAKPGFLERIVAGFQKASDRLLRGAVSAQTGRDRGEALHALKGISANVGAARVAQLCTELILVQEGQPDALADRLAELKAELEVARSALDALAEQARAARLHSSYGGSLRDNGAELRA